MKIHIPTPLRAYTGKQDAVNVPGTTMNEASGRADVRLSRPAGTCLPRRASCARL